MYLEDSSLQTSYNSVKAKLLLSSLTQLGKNKLLNQPETGKTKLLSYNSSTVLSWGEMSTEIESI